ncbi:MAG TPA: ferredoxin reductase [Candidatus Baltobacteraceae bacterium]|nr:ferredoxin reductase [Candidatus Baltobacteraceae bacterium]
MAGTALHGRLDWRESTLVERRRESVSAYTLVLDVPQWAGHDAGQHADVRLTAPDGYSAARSYSIANAPSGNRIELTIEELADGEVSPYLAESLAPGDPLEIRGPIGGWFVWRPEQTEPVQLVAGGSGIVPLMAMIRTRAQTRSRAPFRLLYSVRSPQAVIYADELRQRAAADAGLEISYIYTRGVPDGWPRPAGRIDAETIAQATFSAHMQPACYVCGPTPFVEAAANLLIEAGHDAARIKTERFGPSGAPA